MGGWRTEESRKTGFSSCFPLFLSSGCLRGSQAVLSSLATSGSLLSAWMKVLAEMNRPPRMSFLQATRIPLFLGLAFFFNDHCVSSDQTTACCSSDIIRVTDVSAYLLDFHPHSSSSPLAKIKWKRRGMKMVDGRTSLINCRL